MISAVDFQKGIYLKIDGHPWVIVDFQFVKPGKGTAFVRTKLKNVITGNVVDRSFRSADQFDEVEMEKVKAKYLYSHRDRFFFCKEADHSFRFDLGKDAVGDSADFLKPDLPIEALFLEGKLINISLPIKIQLKVIEAPPGVKGDSAQGGTKIVTLETGAQISVPLFVEEGNIIEVNTETKQYTKRVE